MASTIPHSSKNIWVLLSGTSLLKSKDYVGSVLENNASKLVNGILYYKKCGPKKVSEVKELLSKNNIEEASPDFVQKLSALLEIEPLQAYELFLSYLLYEYSGTPKSIKTFFGNEKSLQTLLHSVWDYYYAERLFSLYSLRQILSNWQKESKHPYRQLFADFLASVNENNLVVNHLISQLETLVSGQTPSRGHGGQYFSDTLAEKLTRNNVNEQLVVLHCILLYFRDFDPTAEDIFKLLKIFSSQGFATKPLSRSAFSSTYSMNPRTETTLQFIGFLESVVVVQCLQLDWLCKCIEQDSDDHPLLKNPARLTELDQLFQSFSPSLQQHSIIFLSWMVVRSCDVPTLESSNEMIRQFGSTACDLKVFEYLERWLLSDAFVAVRGTAVGAAIKTTVYKLLSLCFSIFGEPLVKHSLTTVFNIVNTLLEEESIASEFLTQKVDNGLWIPFSLTCELFPLGLKDFLTVCLTLANTMGCDPVIQLLKDIDCYTEVLTASTAWQWSQSGQSAVLAYDKLLFDDKRLLLRKNTIGKMKTLASGATVATWEDVHLNGLVVLSRLYQEKLRLIKCGHHNAVSDESIEEMFLTTKLACQLLHANIRSYTQVADILEHARDAFRLFTRFSQVPRLLISGLLHLFSVVSQINENQSDRIWEIIAESGFFPYMIGLTKDMSAIADGEDTNTSKIGEIIAFEECISAQYQLCLSYLKLVVHSLPPRNPLSPAILVHILSEIFPSHQRWKYRQLDECARIGHYCLQIFQNVLSLNNPQSKELVEVCKLSLLNKQAGSTLLDIIVNGEAAVREVIEGEGNELALVDNDIIIMVRKSISVLNRLLQIQEKSPNQAIAASALEQSLSSTNTGKPNIILVLSHYVSQPYDSRLSTLAVTLLTRLAKHFPMSMLACFGSQAEFIRDHLLYKLEKVTEDLRLKVAILDYLSACIKHQPGLIEMFLDTDNESTSSDHTSSCLATVLEVLEEKMTEKYFCPEELHCAAMKFLCTFWLQPHLLAIESLKKTKDLWTLICFPLTKTGGPLDSKIVGYVLRILAREIFYSKSLEKDFDSLLLDIFVEIKSEDFVRKMSTQLYEDCCLEPNPPELVFLLSSWRDFLVSLSKYEPLPVDEELRCLVALNLVRSLRRKLNQKQQLDQHLLLILSVTCTFVLHRWGKSCLGDAASWLQEVKDVLYVVDELKETLELGLLTSTETFLAHTLKAFRELSEDMLCDDFMNWLAPWCSLFNYCFSGVEKEVFSQTPSTSSLRLATITLSMFHHLFHLNLDANGFSVAIRNNLVVETLDNLLCEMIKRRACFPLAECVLSTIILLSTSVKTADLLQMTSVQEHLNHTLQISSRDVDEEKKASTFSWLTMFQSITKLMTSLLFTLKHHFTLDAVHFVVTHLSQFEKCFSDFKNFPQTERIERANNAMWLLCLLVDYKSVWMVKHRSSFEKLASEVSRTCYAAIAYLIRPTLLQHALKHLTPNIPLSSVSHFSLETLTFSARKSESLTDVSSEKCLKRPLSHEGDSQPQLNPKMQEAFHTLLIQCLSFLHKFYPTPVETSFMSEAELKFVDANFDLSFSTPNIDPNKGTSFGSLLYCVSYCARLIHKLDRVDFSDGLDSATCRTQLTLILEKALAVLVSRATYTQECAVLNDREKQSIRRELKGELSSVLTTITRQPKRSSSATSLTSTPRSPLNPITEKPYIKHLLDKIDIL